MKAFDINQPVNYPFRSAVLPGVFLFPNKNYLTWKPDGTVEGSEDKKVVAPNIKTWRDNNAIYNMNYVPQYFDGYEGVYKPGYVVPYVYSTDGTYKVEPWSGNDIGFDTMILLHPNQVRFYREHRKDFPSGVPALRAIPFNRDYAITFNGVSKNVVIDPPPLNIIPDMAFRINPVTGIFEQFVINDYDA